MLFSQSWRADAVPSVPPRSYTLPEARQIRPVPIQGAKAFVVIIGVCVGFFDEPSGSPHLTHFTEHLVFDALPKSVEMVVLPAEGILDAERDTR